MTEQVKGTLEEAEDAYEELLALLGLQVGPLESREAPESLAMPVYAPH